MSDRESWMELIRNEYDPAPAHYRMGDDWDDGAGRIADAILADQALLLRKQDEDWNIRKFIDFLRADEGNSVTLLCDNPDFNGQPNCAVECNGYWTNWQDRRFAADTLEGALELAYFECRQWRENPPPEVSPDPLPAYADPNFKYDWETGTYRRTSHEKDTP